MNRKIAHFASPLLLAAALGGVVGLTACAETPRQASLGESIDDSVITTKIKARFIDDGTVSALRISVETYKGIVQLRGFANSTAEIQRAAEIARSVDGVKSVRNDIHLRSAG